MIKTQIVIYINLINILFIFFYMLLNFFLKSSHQKIKMSLRGNNDDIRVMTLASYRLSSELPKNSVKNAVRKKLMEGGNDE